MRIRGPMSVVKTQKSGEQLGNIHRFILHTHDLLELLSYACAPLHYFNIPDAMVKHSLLSGGAVRSRGAPSHFQFGLRPHPYGGIAVALCDAGADVSGLFAPCPVMTP